MFKSLWNYRYFIFSSIRNELRTRFIHSKLGALWMIFNPLAQVMIYAFILSNVLAAKLPGIENKYAFSIYLMAGILGWALFFDVISRSINLFVDNANLMKKINFPRMALASIMLGSCLLNNLILLGSILVVFIFLGHSFNFTILWLIPLMGTVTLFAFGIGLILGVINVFIRDVAQGMPIVLQTLFWFTPIVYPVSIVPTEYLGFLKMNPLFPIIEAYHAVLLYGESPDMMSIVQLNIIGFLIVLFGFFMFRKASPEMVDVL
ncbi:MAG: ABC transporter permease [Flavobacteriales bacterium]|jgi:lipopolysaccharide transport system permease protein|nr:ABC transporter permease [Flavobacteriales bacterium]